MKEGTQFVYRGFLALNSPSLGIRATFYLQRLPFWCSGKEPAFQRRRHGFSPGSGRSPGGGNGNPLQYSCLENLIDREAWRTTVHGVTRVGQDLVPKPPPPSILHMVTLNSKDHLLNNISR